MTSTDHPASFDRLDEGLWHLKVMLGVQIVPQLLTLALHFSA